MINMLALLTLWKRKITALISWFNGVAYTGTQINRSDKTHRLQGVVSHLGKSRLPAVHAGAIRRDTAFGQEGMHDIPNSHVSQNTLACRLHHISNGFNGLIFVVRMWHVVTCDCTWWEIKHDVYTPPPLLRDLAKTSEDITLRYG